VSLTAETGDRGAADRPLPLLAPWNEWWWFAGREGVLSFSRCRACRSWIHPTQQRCPYCLADDVGPESVSGSGTVVAVTINEQQWLDTLPPPYALAIVALDEDPQLRLTTSIVDCRVEEVHIGQRVNVRWEPHGDVWIPVFHPTAEPDRFIDVSSAPIDSSPAIRRIAKFEDRVVLSGVGMSQVGRRLMVNPVALTVDACLNAVADAGLTLSDIDGLGTYPGPSGDAMSEGGATAVIEALSLRPTWIAGGQDVPGPIGSVIAAMMAVASGLCSHVLCFRTVWEATWAQLGREGRLACRVDRISGPTAEYRLPFGALSPTNWIALLASQYLHRYGATRETLGWIALNGRANAARNPIAIYRDPLTMDDYLGARMVSSPLGLYDCDAPCDGAVAIVVSSADAAPDSHSKRIRVEAVGTRVADRVSWDQGRLTHIPQMFGPAQHLWSRTDLRPSDVQVAELYDGFTFTCLSWLEALGFCGLGEAPEFLEGGERIALNGVLPLNTNGGQLSAGRIHGYGLLHEGIVQLRGDGGERQVPGNPQVAVVATGGGIPSGCLLLRAE
jgi:acetyl-CoA acetyltransferase/uncharacterized OB-fold protein